jgi:hypothetical protein
MINIGIGISWVKALYSVAANIVANFRARVAADNGIFEAAPYLDVTLDELNAIGLLDKASLITTPNAYKESKLYSVVPSDGAGDMTVVRATTATRVNADGLIETSPVNLLDYSEDFSNGVWVKTNTTVSTNTTTAPNGTTTADSLLETTANVTHQLWERPLMVAGQTFTQSCYIKTNGRNRVQLQIFDSSTLYVGALFDVVSGTIIATNGTSSIESVGNGWYRCIVSGVCPTSTTGYCVINLATDSYTEASAQDSYTGDASKGVFIWGAQLNIGATAKPYFPTTDRLNIPRIDYTSGQGAILMEPQRTNLALYSEQFDNAYWAKSNSSITSNAAISPDGTLNASLFESTGAAGYMYPSTGILSSAANGTFTYSIYAKEGNTSSFTLLIGAAATYIGDFNLTSVEASTSTANTIVDISNAGNGWYRCSVTASLVASSAYSEFQIGRISLGYNLYFYGAQLEAGSYPTSYIPTVASTVTRNADVISKTGISGLIGQTEGTVFVDIVYIDVTTTNAIGINNGTSSDRVIIFSGSGLLLAQVRVGNVSQFFLNTPVLVGTRYKAAIAYKGSDFAFYVNGNQIGVGSTGTVPTCSVFSYDAGSGGNPFLGKNNSSQLYKTRLTNSELILLTGDSFDTYNEMAEALNYTIQ